jgi:hypothetical protein
MNGITEITDGITEISDGTINCDELICNTFTTGNFVASAISDGVATMTGGNLTGVNNLACNSISIASFNPATINTTTLNASTIKTPTLNVSTVYADTAYTSTSLSVNSTVDTGLSFLGGKLFASSTISADTTNKYFLSQIETTAVNKGWKWNYVPTNTSCMLLDNTGNLQIGDDIRCLKATDSIGCWNNHTGTISFANTGDCASFNMLNAQNAGELHIAENVSRTGKINIGCGTSAVNDINIGTGTSSAQTINVGKFAHYGNSLNSTTPTNPVNLFTNNTSTISIGTGTGGVQLGNASSRYVGINSSSTTNQANINLYSSGNPLYDARIVSTGGTSTALQGAMDLYANTINLNSTGAVGINQTGAGTINIGNSATQTFMYGTKTNITGLVTNNVSGTTWGIDTKITPTTTGGLSATTLDFRSGNNPVYDARIIVNSGSSTTVGQGYLNLIAKNIVLSDASNNPPVLYFGTSGSNIFRFVPWTTAYSGTTLANNVINFPTGANCPTANAGALLRYKYSVIGNTMYLNYYFYQASPGTAGSGVYQYAVPGGYTINTTDMLSSPTSGDPNGTRLGNAKCIYLTHNNAVGGLYLTNQGSTLGLMLWTEVGSGTSWPYSAQNNTNYNYGTTGLIISFEATIPIV